MNSSVELCINKKNSENLRLILYKPAIIEWKEMEKKNQRGISSSILLEEISITISSG